MDGKIYTAFVSADETFDPITHSQEDLTILALNISQKEGEVALATFKVANFNYPFESKYKKSHIIVSYQKQIIFRGLLVGVPRSQDQYTMDIEFMACLPKTMNGLQKLVEKLKCSERWNSLFFNSQTLASDVLESGQDLFYFNPCNHEVILSDIFKGRKTVILSDKDIIADTFKTKIANFPLSSVKVQLCSEWMQSGEGEFNLFPIIAKSFPGGIINTLTPHHLQKSWLKVGDFLGEGKKRTGYQVVESELNVFNPPFTGELNLYPKVTPKFCHLDNQERRFERHWFKGKLVVGWQYRQMRREIVHFTVKNVNTNFGMEKSLCFNIKNVLERSGLPSHISSFFHTNKGHEAILFAKKLARAHLLGGLRSIGIQFKVPWEVGINIDLDTSVVLPSFNNFKSISGKVAEFKKVITKGKAYVWLRVLSLDEDYDENSIALETADFSHQTPQSGIVNLAQIGPHDLVRYINVENHGGAQVDYLSANQSLDLRQVLSEKPTLIEIELLSLKSEGILEHQIFI